MYCTEHDRFVVPEQGLSEKNHDELSLYRCTGDVINSAMTSCHWPRRRGILHRMKDGWTPPKPEQAILSAQQNEDHNQQLWSTLMRGGIWLS